MTSATFSTKMNMNTALALIEETPVEEEKNKAKFITIELKCRAGATAASAVSYKNCRNAGVSCREGQVSELQTISAVIYGQLARVCS